MVLIRIWVNNNEDKIEVLDWMICEIMSNGHISLFDVQTNFEDKIFIKNGDIFGYNKIGWNVKDLNSLFMFKHDTDCTDFPRPKINFEPHYT